MLKRLRILIIISFVVIALGIIVFKIIKVQDRILRVIYPTTYSEYVYKYADENNIDAQLVFAVIKAESNFKSDVISKSNAKGVMQLMDSTAEEVFLNMGEQYEQGILFNPEINIRIGTKYLASLLQKYNGNLYLTIIAYNAGIGNVDKWVYEGIISKNGSDIENIPYKETKMYVQKILKNYKVYQKLY